MLLKCPTKLALKFLKGKMWCEDGEGQKCKLAVRGVLVLALFIYFFFWCAGVIINACRINVKGLTRLSVTPVQ